MRNFVYLKYNKYFKSNSPREAALKAAEYTFSLKKKSKSTFSVSIKDVKNMKIYNYDVSKTIKGKITIKRKYKKQIGKGPPEIKPGDTVILYKREGGIKQYVKMNKYLNNLTSSNETITKKVLFKTLLEVQKEDNKETYTYLLPRNCRGEKVDFTDNVTDASKFTVIKDNNNDNKYALILKQNELIDFNGHIIKETYAQMYGNAYDLVNTIYLTYNNDYIYLSYNNPFSISLNTNNRIYYYGKNEKKNLPRITIQKVDTTTEHLQQSVQNSPSAQKVGDKRKRSPSSNP